MRIWPYPAVDTIEASRTSAPIAISGDSLPGMAGSYGVARFDIIVEVDETQARSMIESLRTDLLWSVEGRECQYMGAVEISEMRVGMQRVRVSFLEFGS